MQQSHVVGSKVGRWTLDFLATPQHELVERVAILRDTDKRDGEQHTPPAWLTDFDDSVVAAFFSSPTLEPSLVSGNEKFVTAVLDEMSISHTGALTSVEVDNLFRGSDRKAEFALALAEAFDREATEVVVPPHMLALLQFVLQDPPAVVADGLDDEAHAAEADD